MPIKESRNKPLVPIYAAYIRSRPGSREIGSVIHSGGFSSGRGVSEVKCAWTRAVPGGVRHVVFKMGEWVFRSSPPVEAPHSDI